MSDSDDKRDSVIRKIRALMAKTTENGCSEAEAKLAAAHVDKLMGEYELSLSDLEVRETICEQVSLRVPMLHMVWQTCDAIKQFTDTKCWSTGRNGVGPMMGVNFFGLPSDVVVAEYLCYLFWRAIDREVSGFGMLNFEHGSASDHERREMDKSFGFGMAERLSERLLELKNKRDWTTKNTTGRDLIVVKGQVVTEQFAKLNLKLRPGAKTQVRIHAASYEKGRTAGDRVGLQQGVSNYSQKRAALR